MSENLGAPQPINPVEQAKRVIMSAEQYAEIEHERPYVFEAEAAGKTATYFGPGHSWDPNNPVWTRFKEKLTEANPDMVLVEGFGSLKNRRQQVVEASGKYSEAEVIGKSGESGLVLKLAAEQGIDFDSPEPELRDEISYLEQQGFSRESIFAYYFFRMIPQWHQHMEKESFREYIQREIDTIKQAAQWPDFDFSYANAEWIAEQFWGEEIDLDDPEYYKDKVDPIPWKEKKDQQTEVNLVARASNLFRDEYMIEKLAEYLKTHDRIFIVLGASHAVMLEPAMRELLKAYET